MNFVFFDFISIPRHDRSNFNRIRLHKKDLLQSFYLHLRLRSFALFLRFRHIIIGGYWRFCSRTNVRSLSTSIARSTRWTSNDNLYLTNQTVAVG